MAIEESMTAHGSPADPADMGGPREFCTSRRSLLRGLAAIGVTTIGAGILAGCSDDASDSGAETTATTAPTTEASASADSGGGNAAAGVPTGEIPVGEARVVDLAGQRVVVAQPTAGKFVAFSSICTHQGTQVESLGGLKIRCPNHGSEFDGATGKATKGPATTALGTVDISVSDGEIVPA